MNEKSNKKREMATRRIKKAGTFSYVLGCFKIIATIVLLLGHASYPYVDLFKYSYSDLALNVTLGIVLIILGDRIKKNITKSTKKYVWIILVLSGIFSFLNIVVHGQRVTIIFFLFAFSIYTLTLFKYVKISEEQPKYQLAGKKWILVICAFIFIIGAGLALDFIQYNSSFTNNLLKTPSLISSKFTRTTKTDTNIFTKIPEIDKNFNTEATDHALDSEEQIGNLYRNKKHGFKIKFPEGWEIKDGDGQNVVKKAVNGGSTIGILVGDFKKTSEFSAIKEQFIKETGLPLTDKEVEEAFSELNANDFSDNDFEEMIAGALEGLASSIRKPKLIEKKIADIGGEKALYTKTETNVKVLHIGEADLITVGYTTLHRGIFYNISGAFAKEDTDLMEKKILLSLASFTFEDFLSQN